MLIRSSIRFFIADRHTAGTKDLSIILLLLLLGEYVMTLLVSSCNDTLISILELSQNDSLVPDEKVTLFNTFSDELKYLSRNNLFVLFEKILPTYYMCLSKDQLFLLILRRIYASDSNFKGLSSIISINISDNIQFYIK